MDTEKTIILKDKEEITCQELDNDFIAVVQDYVELNRHLQEINQLFEIFQFNIERLFESYEVQSDDHIIRKDGFNTTYTDFIAINSFITNIISSGRSLVDSVDICMRNSYGKISKSYKMFETEYKCQVYDNNFAYRFFYDLRNFSQHNHVPVSTTENFCCFDINQILNTPHFDSKKEVRGELERIQHEIKEKYKDIFHLSLSHSLMQYISGTAQVHKGFWIGIKNRLFELKNIIDDAVITNPEILNHNNPRFDGYILYTIQEKEGWHAFAPYADTDTYYDNHLQEADDFYKESNSNYLELEKHFKACL